MSEDTISTRLLAKLCEQSGLLSANVLELQLRLQDALEENVLLHQQVQDQGARIANDKDLLTLVREERDKWRASAEPDVKIRPIKKRAV